MALPKNNICSRILRFDLDKVKVIGFDTGLDNKAFAQAKMAQFLSQNGFIVKPDGSVKSWKAEGVHELESPAKNTMVIWGSDFNGISLDSLVHDQDKRQQALDAVLFYLKAKITLLKDSLDSAALFPGACGAIFCNKGSEHGTFFFPPERLVKRSIEANGDEAVNNSQQWYHPDLNGEKAVVFTAAVMLYAIFTSKLPFVNKDIDVLRHDIRESVFMPLKLAAPGFDRELSELLNDVLFPIKNKASPSAQQLIDCLEKNRSRKIADFYTELTEEEMQKIKNEHRNYKKKQDLRIKTKRFIIRNTAIIAVCLCAIIAAGLFIHGYLRQLSERFNTIGLTPVEVAMAYYNAFNTLDHDIIDACTHGRNSRNDITMVMNLFVISRARQAYELTSVVHIPAQDWLDTGMPQTDALVFGITDLVLQILSETENEVFIQADYFLWVPPGYLGEYNQISEHIPVSVSINTKDILTLGLINDAWRIIEIDRKTY